MKNSVDRSIFDEKESEVRSYCRHYNPVFISASGSKMKDTDGEEYIDFLAACGSLNYGHNDPDMSKALLRHISGNGLTIGLDLHSVAKGEFLESFNRLILEPRGMDHRVQFTGPTGTNAVEAAFKLARKVTGRTNIISFTNGFHGVTLGALAATGNKYHRMGGCLPGVSRAPFDGYMGDNVNTADYLEQLLTDPSSGVESPAAIVLETVQGEGGLNAASSEWLRQIAAIAKRHGALLIVDDVQAGCGRTGTFFSFENMGIEPDIVTMSKSISGYGLPMAIVLIKPEHDVWEPAEHNGTFRGNNHAFVTAKVALEKFWSNDDFNQCITAKAKVINERLTEVSKFIPAAYLKGRGMMQGLSVESGDLANNICRLCFEKGLILETSGAYGEVIKVLAPLTISMEALEAGLEILQQSVEEITGETKTTCVIPPQTANSAFPDTYYERGSGILGAVVSVDTNAEADSKKKTANYASA